MQIFLIITIVILVLLLVVLYGAHNKLKAENSIVQSRNSELQSSCDTLRLERKNVDNSVIILREECATLRAKLDSANEKCRVQSEAQAKQEEQSREAFKNIANEILAEQSHRFKSTNKEELDILLKPFKDNITEFRTRVETIYSTENEQRGALRNELKNLMELNRRITTETTNLTNALRGNSKVQGDWGEMILETILDSSNLQKGLHYSTQLNIKDETGNNMRPDVVLNLPEEKQIVIDSKVSLTAFVNYTGEEDSVACGQFLKQHVESVRQHVKSLGNKEYQKLVNSPDFVIMFIPNEPAFLAALQSDNSIWADAYEKRVIISSPTNLFALLKLVDDLWRRNAQNKNTADIVTCGTKLYDQLVNFTAALEGVGTALDVAKDKYAEAHKRLTSGNDNIVRVGERLRKLGLPVKKRQSTKVLEGNVVEEDE